MLRCYPVGDLMKVLVAVKRVVDYNARIHVKSDGTGIELGAVKFSMNPFDEIALEEAIRLKEKGSASEVIAVSLGADTSQETLRTALALGADRAILVKTGTELDSLLVAKLLRVIVEREKPQLVFLGKQAIDSDNNQTGQMLAALLGWPQGTFASKVGVIDNTLQVTREVEGGLETLSLQLPAVVTVDLRLNEPRYASLPNIMRAKKKPLDVVLAAECGVDLASPLRVLRVDAPAPRKSGVKVSDVQTLVDKLRQEAKVIP